MQLPQTARWSDDLVELFLLEPAHANDAYVGWLNDREVNRFLESRFTTHDVLSVRSFIQSALDSDQVLFLGIRSRALGRHVGNIKIAIDPHHGRGEVGIMIGDREAWGHGIGTAAIRTVSAIAGSELRLRRLTAGCYGSNAGSARAFEKAGFQIEAVRRGHFLLDGRPEDLILLAKDTHAQL